jgi:hypothetical protein
VSKGGFKNVATKIAPILEASSGNGDVPFVSMDNMKGSIKNAFETALDLDSSDPDMGSYEFVLLNTLLVALSNCVTYDKSSKKFIPCIKWIADNILTENVCQGVADDRLIKDEAGDGVRLTFSGDTLVYPTRAEINTIILKKSGDGFSANKDLTSLNSLIKYNPKSGLHLSKGIVILNLRRIVKTIYPAVSTMCKKMNAVEFKDVPQEAPNKCVEIK